MPQPPRTIAPIDLHDDVPPGLSIGTKAARLAELARLGLPVPDALVVPAEATDASIDALGAEVAAAMGGRRLAVRSSCIAEDQADASFAGQYETVLDVDAEPEAVAAAIRHVRRSASADRVAAYAGAHATEMAVLVMPMIDADAAGIAFTRDPVGGSGDVVIEAVRGLGDRLAAGETVGERWRVGADVVSESSLGVLTAAEARTIADTATRCREAAGGHQDVEWALAEGRPIVLQTRPITAIHDVEPVPMDQTPPPGPWEWDAAHNRLPLSPLTSSFFCDAFTQAGDRLIETYGAPIKRLVMTTVNGYVYIQVVPPAGKPGSPAPPKLVMRMLFRIVPPLRRRRAAARSAIANRVDRRLLDQWNTQVGPETDRTLARWQRLDRSALSNDELSDLFGDAVELAGRTFGWNMVTDMSYLFPLAELNDFVGSELGDGIDVAIRLLAGSSPSGYDASMRHLAGLVEPGQRDAIRAGSPVDVAALGPDFATAYEEHVTAYGLRILGFDLRYETLLERPGLELARLATMPERVDPGQDAARLLDELRGRLDATRAARLDQLVAEARRTYPIREAGETVNAKAMGIVRLLALEAGRRMSEVGDIDAASHVVFLTVDEITDWLSGRSDLNDLVRLRRGQDLWARGHSPAPSYGAADPLPDIDYFPPEIQPIMRAISLITTHDQSPTELADGVDGVGASPGVHTGPARIVRGPEDFATVRSGDVLVAPITTSPWEVLFPFVGAIVTEGGGLLSHPAIVAREYGLPAVVGCAGALDRLTDGQLVRVDGAAGTVTPVERGVAVGRPDQG